MYLFIPDICIIFNFDNQVYVCNVEFNLFTLLLTASSGGFNFHSLIYREARSFLNSHIEVPQSRLIFVGRMFSIIQLLYW